MKLRQSQLQFLPEIDAAVLHTLTGCKLLLHIEKNGESFVVCDDDGQLQVFHNEADVKTALAKTVCRQWLWYSDDTDSEMMVAKH